MTAHEALSHAFVAEAGLSDESDLLPVVKKNFNARRTLHAAIDTIQAINKLRRGGQMMDGAVSREPNKDSGKAVKAPLEKQPVPESVDGEDVKMGGMSVSSKIGDKGVGQGLWNAPSEK